jgi:hypothetical protein
MKKYLLKSIILLSLFCISFSSFSQAREDDFDDNLKGRRFLDRLYTGGNIGANFGTLSYFVDVSPILGYRVTKDFSVGIGAKYMYLGLTGVPNSGTSIYGGSIFSRYLFLKNFLAHAELETINLPVQNQFSGEIKREWVPIGLVGGGYRQSIGGVSYIQLMLLYDVIGDPRNPYASPFGPQSRLYFRGGITIGL